MKIARNAELVTIGNELLSGKTTDTNSAFIAGHLELIGLPVTRITSVGDSRQDILDALREAGNRADVVIVTGGLGPTSDDITKPALCDFFDTRLVFREDIFAHIETILAKKRCTVNEHNRRQAELPERAMALHNTEGTAPGLWFEKEETIFISLPGVPYEMKELVKTQVLPRLSEKFSFQPTYYRTVITQGTFEAQLAELLSDFEKNLPGGITLAYLPSPGIIKLRIGGRGDDISILQGKVDEQVNVLQKIIPQYIIGYDEQTPEMIVGKLLSERQQNIAVAESCTGGAISSLITAVPGSSKYFKGGIVAYSNEIKKDQLAISPTLIETYGAVSKQVVEDMATNARLLFNSNWSIAVSGIAGPSGGSTAKPVGTIWIAISGENYIRSAEYRFGDNRQRNIRRASLTALNMLRRTIIEQKPDDSV